MKVHSRLYLYRYLPAEVLAMSMFQLFLSRQLFPTTGLQPARFDQCGGTPYIHILGDVEHSGYIPASPYCI